MSKYLGIFSDRESVANEFEVAGRKRYLYGDAVNPPIPDDFPTDEQIVVAAYEYEDYSGSAYVLWHKAGKVFEVHAGHCSCYGLEGQWTPEETTLEFLAKRLRDGHYGMVDSRDVREKIKEFLDRMGAAEYQGA